MCVCMCVCMCVLSECLYADNAALVCSSREDMILAAEVISE